MHRDWKKEKNDKSPFLGRSLGTRRSAKRCAHILSCVPYKSLIIVFVVLILPSHLAVHNNTSRP